MKCPVCGKEFTSVVCPRCRFVTSESTNYEAMMQELGPRIEKAKTAFRQSIHYALTIYRWKEEQDKIVLDREEALQFGTLAELCGKQTLMKQEFARIPELKTIELKIAVTIKEHKDLITISVPNLDEPALQLIGIEVKEDGAFRVLLHNTNGKQTTSDWQAIFSD